MWKLNVCINIKVSNSFGKMTLREVIKMTGTAFEIDMNIILFLGNLKCIYAGFIDFL